MSGLVQLRNAPKRAQEGEGFVKTLTLACKDFARLTICKKLSLKQRSFGSSCQTDQSALRHQSRGAKTMLDILNQKILVAKTAQKRSQEGEGFVKILTLACQDFARLRILQKPTLKVMFFQTEQKSIRNCSAEKRSRTSSRGGGFCQTFLFLDEVKIDKSFLAWAM